MGVCKVQDAEGRVDAGRRNGPFPSVNDAVQAGKDIIRELGLFNRTVKLIKTDFSVRCGVNAGFVYFDETTPLETMADRVIDVAGHMQKYADPNTVAVA